MVFAGPGKAKDDGKRIPLDVKSGDKVHGIIMKKVLPLVKRSKAQFMKRA